MDHFINNQTWYRIIEPYVPVIVSSVLNNAIVVINKIDSDYNVYVIHPLDLNP